jgi:NAD-dependent dihydropyrimidine dehydrogenase PreA subunit
VSDGLFIAVEIDATITHDPAIAVKLAEVCPVDIFLAGPDGAEIVAENLDECVLCQLCIHIAPPGSIRITKLYSGETLPPGSG